MLWSAVLVASEIEISLHQSDSEVWAEIINEGEESVSLITLFTSPLFAVQIKEKNEFHRPVFMVDVETEEPLRRTIELKSKEKLKIDLLEEKPLNYEFITGKKETKFVYEIIDYPIWNFNEDKRFKERIESNILEVDLNKLKHNKTAERNAE